MDNGLHFISGLPRSGSTLLAALLRQNPRFLAGMTTPVGSLFNALQRGLSQGNEGAVFIDDAQRLAVLRGLFTNYYAAHHPTRVVFDTNRQWCAKLPTLATLFPAAKVICCVRHMPWVLDSFERLIQTNPLELSGIFGYDPGGSVYTRCEGLAASGGLAGAGYNGLREAVWGAFSDRLLLLTYETLTAEPGRAMQAIYDHLGEPRFTHDFDNVVYDEADEFDRRLGTPNLHRVRRRVTAHARATVLPPDLFARFESDSFWRDPARMRPGLRIV